METIAERKPKIRFQKNYVVEENLDAIEWPQECAACNGPVEIKDAIHLKEKFKGFGEIKVELAGIPYCQTCFPKIGAGKQLDRTHLILSFVIGIPLGVLLIAMLLADQNTNFIWCGAIFFIAYLIGYGIAWLFVKLPARIFLKGRIIEPVSAWLITEQKADKKEGISVIIAIPNKSYAGKFAQLNGIAV